MSDHIRFVELGRLTVPGMSVRVRWFPIGTNQNQWRAPSNILSFSRIVGGAVVHRDVSKPRGNFQQAGPLTFWPHSAVWESQRLRSQVLTVSAYFDDNFTSTMCSNGRGGISIDDFSMLEMMQLLHDEVRTPGASSKELVSSIGNVLRIKLSRLMNQRARVPSSRKPCSNVNIALVRDSIDAANGNFPTTTTLAAQFQVGRRNLLRLFKETTGTSPSRYIEETKLERAKTLLATSSLTMKQIAYEAGYSSGAYFSFRFRQLTGLTPREFRSRARRQV